MDHHDDPYDRGLAFDLATLLRRRHVLGLIAGAGLASLVGCAPGPGMADSRPTTGTATTGTATGSPGATCGEIPAETAGPFPGDGSNGPNILTRSGIVRGDIRSSFGTGSGAAQGVPLTIELTVVDTAKGCAAYPGAAVYIWQCDREGRYSMYAEGLANENYLRGVQAADGTGVVRFTSVFPGAYPGRWPHVHFEVYPSLARATPAGGKIATSQLALPADACRAAYATDGYAASVGNLARTSLQTDMVFRDGYSQQLPTVSGDARSGYLARLTVPV